MIKILLITAPRLTGLNYHRQITPFRYMDDCEAYAETEWSDEFTDEHLKQYQIVSFLRTISLKGNTEAIVNRLHSLGIKVHFDIDDYWVLPITHPLYQPFKEQDVSRQTIVAIKLADLITTSTAILAGMIKQHNDNVYVLPNAIHPEEEQWVETITTNDRVRFGYIAGVHHTADVELLKPNIDKMFKDRTIYGKFQLCAAGFNLNKTEETLSMNPYYHWVEQVFTNNYAHIKDKEYATYLRSNNPEQNELTWSKDYRRLWGMDTFNYGKLYNLIDVSLVPLQENLFSACKSELKLIEAGFMKKAVIVSNVKPYDVLATKENSILVNPNRNGIDWFTSMRALVKDKERVKDLGEALYESVKVKYDIRNVNIERKQLMENLCE